MGVIEDEGIMVTRKKYGVRLTGIRLILRERRMRELVRKMKRDLFETEKLRADLLQLCIRY